MKKIIAVIAAVICVAGALAGCGNNSEKVASKTGSIVQPKSVNEVLDEKKAEATTAPVAVPKPEKEYKTKPVDTADINLTIMSSTAVYSEVFNMTNNPADYVGKKVIMSGTASYYEDQQTGNIYHACIIKDAAACCSQGIEYELDADYTLEDYPNLNDEIKVAGVFTIYEENGQQYSKLEDAYYVS